MNENGSHKKLSAKQEKAIALIISGEENLETIKQLRISETTFYRWCNSEVFQYRLQQETKKLKNAALGKMQRLVDKSVNRLEVLLDSGDEKIVLRASQIIIDNVLKIRDLEELEERLARLERVSQNQ